MSFHGIQRFQGLSGYLIVQGGATLEYIIDILIGIQTKYISYVLLIYL